MEWFRVGTCEMNEMKNYFMSVSIYLKKFSLFYLSYNLLISPREQESHSEELFPPPLLKNEHRREQKGQKAGVMNKDLVWTEW